MIRIVDYGVGNIQAFLTMFKRLGLEATVALLDDVLPALDTLPVDGQLHAIALRRYRAAIPTETSFVDHVTLALMEQESITTVFALDADLAGPGVRLVPPLG